MVIVKEMSEVPAMDVSHGTEVVGAMKRVLIGPADHAPTFAVRLFTLAPGGHTPFHSHPFEHGVIVLRGAGTVLTAMGPRAIGEGSVVFVPPGERHQFRNAGSIPLQFLCIVPVGVEA
ncbi:MAG TPA: cupin domain-containing protein [Candidatus Acetothermia bacterium]|nr:cupin domain-containing protein [Candidatus Acetothermia bacterium]